MRHCRGAHARRVIAHPVAGRSSRRH